ncbi:putative uncharacterized protein [Mycolicibacterium brisbanense]|uniref:Uncharacterized protein n=1 Tax=Mycolicibacterium brisbanense TaxID=146020 RepID=A0A100W0N1_9MYCO|nr:putative uncharacterized protein [Mycolicibacterium brisbanense]
MSDHSSQSQIPASTGPNVWRRMDLGKCRVVQSKGPQLNVPTDDGDNGFRSQTVNVASVPLGLWPDLQIAV